MTTFEVSADAYDRHIGRYSAELAAALIRVAGVRLGWRALDIGCGPGALTGALAALLGPEQVAAVDPSEPFVAVTRERVPGADVRHGVAEALPFGNGEFDAVLSQLVLNLLTDPEAGVREMRRVARPGGVVAAAVWDFSGGMTLLRAFWDAAREVDPDGAAARDEGTVMRYCRPDELEGLWKSAGFTACSWGGLLVRAAYRDFDDLWAPFAEGVGRCSGVYCASLDPARRAALRDACSRRLGSPKGPFELSARAWYAVGTA